jgi:hypothetical protein
MTKARKGFFFIFPRGKPFPPLAGNLLLMEKFNYWEVYSNGIL